MKKLCLAALLLLVGVPLVARDHSRPVAPAPPRLVVMLVVDQMRADYIQLYGHHWTKGLRRLLDTGATFPLAEYPYAITVTCAGHATISTGTVPATHGMVGNEWYDRQLRKEVRCTEDARVTSVPFGGLQGTERHSLKYLRTNTLSDELRLQATRPPTVVGISLKARSAMTLAGRPSPTTYAVWEEDDGTWATSTAFTTTAWPVVDTWAAGNAVRSAYGQSWTRALPESAYLFADALPGEPAQHLFPHRLVSKSGAPDLEFVNLWERSPLSDAALSSLAQHMVRELKMGQVTTGTDFLGVSFSAVDLVGHAFGPYSHEVQDTLIRLDASIGDLLTTLDAVVGRDHYVVALSADHGVAPVPEHTFGRTGTGRYTSTQMRTAIENTLTAALGEGPHVAAVIGSNIYLTPGTATRTLATPGARESVTAALAAVPGIDRAYWSDDLTSSVATTDPILDLARRSYAVGNSGDLMVIATPYWIQRTLPGTTHGTPWGYDRRVPILFAGAGITPGRYLTPASPADIAPTLAELMGITLARTDGRVLTPAIAR